MDNPRASPATCNLTPMNKTRTASTALASTLFLFLGSCASQKTLKQYQDEVRALREERTSLKKENRDLRSQNDANEVAMIEANTQPVAPAPVADNPMLDKVGVEYGTTREGNPYISIPASDVNFASGKAELTSKGKETLKVVGRVLKEDHGGGRYWIEGHTDTDPIKKSNWDSNRDLSVARAMSVLHYLVEECDVPDEQCVIAGHGQYQPVSAGTDAGSKARNRRVEIVVHRR
jgi:chemotaxis protein MotB